jgi:radical SAM protein with 4Fe4S-binding SPASM domain
MPSHEQAVRGIRTLQRHGVGLGTILVLNRCNVGYPEEIADYFIHLGVRSTKINPINMIGDAQLTWNTLAITSEEYFEFLNRFIDYIIDARLPLSEFNLSQYLKYLVRRMHDYRCMRSNCGAGKSFFLVDSKGDVYPCAHSAGIPEWRIGTIYEADGDLVKLGKRNPVVQQFRERLVEGMHEARTCPWRHFCEGGCAVNSYQKFGTILAPDALCAFYERMYPRLLELLATSPSRFQRLLDVMFGGGQVVVVSFELGASRNSANMRLPWNDQRKEVIHH